VTTRPARHAAALLDLARSLRTLDPGHAILRWCLRENRQPGQLFLLLVATGFTATVMLGFRSAIFTPTGLVAWVAMRWAIGEFLWSWMAADHCFSGIGKARRNGQLRDWRLTTMTRGEIAGGYTHATTVFLAIGVVAWGVVDMVAPLPEGPNLSWEHRPVEAALWRFGIPVALTVSHVATAYWASARCVSRALGSDGGVGVWAMTLGGLGIRIAATLAVGFFLPVLLLAPALPWNHFPADLPDRIVAAVEHLFVLSSWKVQAAWLAVLLVVPTAIKLARGAISLGDAGEDPGGSAGEE
jgi:hypothetical protein